MEDRFASIRALFDPYVSAISQLDRNEAAALALTLGILFFAILSSILFVRSSRRASAAGRNWREQVAALRADLDRTKALLLSEPQVLVSWTATADEPEIIGDARFIGEAAGHRPALAFGTWLDASAALNIEHALDALRAGGESFDMVLTTNAGRSVEAEGRIIGGRAILRLRDVSGAKHDLANLERRHRTLNDEVQSLRALIEAMPPPIWVRDEAGRLIFANAAYARAVEARDTANAIERGLELFSSAARADLVQAQGAGLTYSGRLPAIVAGTRRSFDVLAVPTPRGHAGIAIEVTEAETMRAQLRRLAEAHRRTLDQLATGVAIFGADHKLAFYNAAYHMLWDLDPAFLEDGPSDSDVLERLRAARKLPEQQNFRLWKSELHEAYQSSEPQSHEWHLPDGRTLRVVTTPNPEGGVIYLFEDVTERLELTRRYDALIRVQGETLDNLGEAVAVFGSDGCLRLNNPSFAALWRLDPAALAARPHIETVIGWCRDQHDDASLWRKLAATVTSIDNRELVAARLERRDGSVLDCSTVPLPDGATLVTFQDVTGTVNVERALRERNEALEEANRIKVDFVHHVSYELRSPLTNIIGFGQILGEPSTGPLNETQREYLSHITSSSNALLALTDNILDLATIDAGAMTLDVGPVDIRATMEIAAEGVQDRLVTNGVKIDFRTAPGIGSFPADARRVRQVLFNLLSNAVGFSPPGSTVVFEARRSPDAVTFAVTDHGPGIPAEMMDKVFDWFETHSLGSRHRGTGLGLSLVRSFVELHGGTVTIDSVVGYGTTVTCRFPTERTAARTAAE